MAHGLRERKKQKTRSAIQRAALKLFEKRGFQATTVEDIAAAAEISPSTFFNYFSSKEAVFLEDEYDPLILQAFAAQPPDVAPLEALHQAMRSVFATFGPEAEDLMRRRMRLIAREPVMRAALFNQFAELVDMLAGLLASRAGRPAGDFAIRNLAGAFLGVLLQVTMTAAADPDADLIELTDRALSHLEAGLPI